MKIQPYPEFTEKVNLLVQEGKHTIPEEQFSNYPSSVGSCIRRLFYSRTLSVVRNEPIENLGNMTVGNIMEDGFVQHVVIPSGIFRGRTRISSRELRASGTTDQLVIDPVTGKKIALENKSPKNPFYALRDLEKGEMSRDYYYQHQIYIHQGQFPYTVHIVLDRNNIFGFKSYKVSRDKEAWADIKYRIAILEFAIKKRILPEREYNPHGKGDWHCNYCPFGPKQGDGRCVEDPEGTTMEDLGKLLKSRKRKSKNIKNTVTVKKRKPAGGKFQI